MKRKLASYAAIPTALLLTAALASCGASNEPSTSDSTSDSAKSSDEQLASKLDGAGASSQKAAVGAWKVGFEGKYPDTTVNYDPVGSGGGRKQFIDGATNFGGTDAYLSKDQLKAAQERCGGEVMEIPAYISPIAVAYNLPSVKELQLSPDTLAKIFDQKIKKWNDEAIKKDNPDAELPDKDITVVNRSDESGTTENFVEYLSIAAKDSWPHEVSGDWPVEGGEAAKGTSGVVKAIESAEGTVGYADASQVKKLGNAKIKVGEEYVKLTSEAAAKIVEASEKVEGRDKYDFAIDVKRDTTEAGTYPIVLVSYTMACPVYKDDETANTVKAWLNYIISEEAQKASAQAAGSAPISADSRKKYKAAIDSIKAK